MLRQVAGDILKKLPPVFDMDKTRKIFGISISPTTVVLLQVTMASHRQPQDVLHTISGHPSSDFEMQPVRRSAFWCSDVAKNGFMAEASMEKCRSNEIKPTVEQVSAVTDDSRDAYYGKRAVNKGGRSV